MCCGFNKREIKILLGGLWFEGKKVFKPEFSFSKAVFRLWLGKEKLGIKSFFGVRSWGWSWSWRENSTQHNFAWSFKYFETSSGIKVSYVYLYFIKITKISFFFLFLS